VALYHVVLYHVVWLLIWLMCFTWNFQKNGQEAAVIESPPETLQSIGNLLGGPPDKYELSITNKITVRSNNPLYGVIYGVIICATDIQKSLLCML